MFAELLPLLLFFLAFKVWGIYTATGVAIGISALQILWSLFKKKPITNMQWIALILLTTLGGATILLQDVTYIKWKPTAVYWGFALVFFTTHFMQKPLIERLLGERIQLPAIIWRRLNLSWGLFFSFLGAANIYLIQNFDTETWVHFKVFGGFFCTLLFVIVQGLYLSRHVQD
jgi:intracellular septation protein